MRVNCTTLSRQSFGAARAVALAVALSGMMLAPAAALAEDLKGTFRGFAYGAFANAKAGPIRAELGETTRQACPCQGTGGRTLVSSTDSIVVGDLLSIGEVRNTAFTQKTETSARIRNTSTVSGLNLLDGLITADAVVASASVTADEARMTRSFAGSRFANLKIAGRAVTSSDVHTRIQLAGVGVVTLKKVIVSGDLRQNANISVTMLAVDVTRSNRFGLPVGARISVGQAVAGYTRVALDGIVNGTAFSNKVLVNVGDGVTNQLGKTTSIGIGCIGTGGVVRATDSGTVEVENILSLVGSRMTAFGDTTGTETVARTAATVDDLSLFGGLISAASVRAVSKDTYEPGTRVSSTAGSGVTALRVAGVPLGNITRPNVRVDLPGIGYVVINEQIIADPRSRRRTQANGLHVFVTLPANRFGLTAGSEIVVAHADSTIWK